MSHNSFTIVDKISQCIRPKIEMLEQLWQQIGYRTEVIEARRSEVLHYFCKLSEDMLKEENECKEEILDDIKESKAEVEKLCRELNLPMDKPQLGEHHPLMGVWDTYQEICNRLKILRQQRVDKMKTLYDVEYPLCLRLGELPLSLVKDDETPQDKQFIEVERNISRLRRLLDERSKEFALVRSVLVDLLADLEIQTTATVEHAVLFQKSVVASDSTSNFILSDINLQKLNLWFSEVQKLHTAKTAEVARLREQIVSVARRLNLSDSEISKKAMTGSKYSHKKCSTRLIDELSHTLDTLNAEKLRKLPLVIEGTRKELREAFERCYLSDLQRKSYLSMMNSTECTDELLADLDAALDALRKMRGENEQIFQAVDTWLELVAKQQMLDERAADPNRYKNRGGGLLQEEKERKEVALALPKKERDIYNLTNEYLSRTGQPFLLSGLTAEEFVEYKKSEYEDEKMRKREMQKTTQVGTSTLHTTAKKNVTRQGAPPSASRIVTPLTNSTVRSNLRSAAKIGQSTPNLAMQSRMQNTPLAASTRNLNFVGMDSDDHDATLNTLSKANRKRTSGHTVATISGQQSPPKKRCLETIPSEHEPTAYPAPLAPKVTKGKQVIGTSSSARNLRAPNLISPAPRVFASPLGASSPSLTNLRAIPSNGGATKTANKAILGLKAKIDSKSNLSVPKKARTSNNNLKKISSTNLQTSRQKNQEGYPFAKHVAMDVDGGSVIDFNKLPESFIVGHGSPLMPIFHNASLDPDSGVLAGHSDTTTNELAVDSILVGPSVAKPAPAEKPVSASSRFAMPPPQLSSTLIAHTTRSQTASRR